MIASGTHASRADDLVDRATDAVLDLILPPLISAADADLAIDVVGYQFGWRYAYPSLDKKSRCVVESPMRLPQGRSVVLSITSDDIVHEWTVPTLSLKKDAIPGLINLIQVPTETLGTYRGSATPMSGDGFEKMAFEVRIVSMADYEAWATQALVAPACKAPSG